MSEVFVVLKEIFNRTLALKLRDMGNPIVDAKVNLKQERYVIYLFEDTIKLRHDLCKLTNK